MKGIIELTPDQVDQYERGYQAISNYHRTHGHTKVIRIEQKDDGALAVKRIRDDGMVTSARYVDASEPAVLDTITVRFGDKEDTYTKERAAGLLDALNSQAAGRIVYALWSALDRAYTAAWGPRDHPATKVVTTDDR